MPKIICVAFDMAGTTVQDHKEVETCFANACRIVGLNTTEERILSLQGYAKFEVFKLLWTEQLGTSIDIIPLVNQSYDTFCQILEEHYINNPIYPTEYTLEIFDYLKSKNIKILLTTGFYRKVANIILEKLGWTKGLNSNFLSISTNSIIDLSVTPDEAGAGRPNPAMLHFGMKTLGISDSKSIINIGDTPVDIEFGKNANVKYALAVTNGTHSEKLLSGLGADGLLANLSELKIYI